MFRSMLVAVAALSVVGCAAQNITATPSGITLKFDLLYDNLAKIAARSRRAPHTPTLLR